MAVFQGIVHLYKLISLTGVNPDAAIHVVKGIMRKTVIPSTV